jgi:hypothetical protein
MAGEKSKNAWLAVLLTFFVPGLGQAYAGRYERGLIILAVAVFYSFFILQTLTLIEANFLAEGETLLTWATENFIRLGVNGLRLLLSVILALVLYVWILVDAYLSVSNSHRGH